MKDERRPIAISKRKVRKGEIQEARKIATSLSWQTPLIAGKPMAQLRSPHDVL